VSNALVIAGAIFFHAGWTIDSENDDDLAIPAVLGILFIVAGVITAIV
jgi:hypothetical protein